MGAAIRTGPTLTPRPAMRPRSTGEAATGQKKAPFTFTLPERGNRPNQEGNRSKPSLPSHSSSRHSGSIKAQKEGEPWNRRAGRGFRSAGALRTLLLLRQTGAPTSTHDSCRSDQLVAEIDAA